MTDHSSVFSNNTIEITSEFPCGNARNIRHVGQSHFTAETRADKGCDENYDQRDFYFCVRITNRSADPHDVTLDIHSRDYAELDEAYAWALSDETWWPVQSQVFTENDNTGKVRVSLRVDPGQSVYVSNAFWYPPSDVMRFLEATARRHPDRCILDTLGMSAQRRPMGVLTIDRTDREPNRRLIIAGSPQPSEIGPWACRGIIELLLDEQNALARRILNQWTVDIIPHTNPDGAAHGTVMLNGAGLNPLFDFSEPAQRFQTPEAAHLWQWVTERAPEVYLEFHSYFQSNRRFNARPYVFDPALYPGLERRKLAAKVSDRLQAVSDGGAICIPAGHEQFSRSLPYRLIERQGIISHLYKLHMRNSLEDNTAQACRVLQAVVETVDSNTKADGDTMP